MLCSGLSAAGDTTALLPFSLQSLDEIERQLTAVWTQVFNDTDWCGVKKDVPQQTPLSNLYPSVGPHYEALAAKLVDSNFAMLFPGFVSVGFPRGSPFLNIGHLSDNLQLFLNYYPGKATLGNRSPDPAWVVLGQNRASAQWQKDPSNNVLWINSEPFTLTVDLISGHVYFCARAACVDALRAGLPVPQLHTARTSARSAQDVPEFLAEAATDLKRRINDLAQGNALAAKKNRRETTVQDSDVDDLVQLAFTHGQGVAASSGKAQEDQHMDQEEISAADAAALPPPPPPAVLLEITLCVPCIAMRGDDMETSPSHSNIVLGMAPGWKKLQCLQKPKDEVSFGGVGDHVNMLKKWLTDQLSGDAQHQSQSDAKLTALERLNLAHLKR